MATAKLHSKARVALSCPKCGNDIQRINKNTFDKVINLVFSVKRYKCYRCFWQGIRHSSHH